MSEDPRWDLSCAGLIAEVKKRPGIYDRLHPDYKKDEKERLWLEICNEIVPNWNEIALAERNSRVLLVQRKWKNLRDSFRKELNIQNELKPPKYPKKKREYLYYKSMQFLEPFLIKDAEVTRKKSQLHKNQSCDEQKNVKFESEISQIKSKRSIKRSSNYEFCDDTQNGDSDSSSNIQKSKQVKKASTEAPTVELWDESSETENLNDVANYTFHEDIDEDRYFLLSLLPYLRNLTGLQNLSVRIEFLEILKRINISNNNSDPLKTS